MTSASPRPRWWEWPSALCVEAPLVALLWQEVSARSLGAQLEIYHRGLLALALWLAYLADRWVDAWFTRPRTARHLVARRWRWPLLVTWILGVGLGVFWAAMRLQAREWSLCLLATAAAAVQVLALARLTSGRVWARWLRRSSVAALFTGGVLLFVWFRSAALPETKTAWGIAVAIVVGVNLALIVRAEKRDGNASTEVELAEKRDSNASTEVELAEKRDSSASTEVELAEKRDSSASTEVELAEKRDSDANAEVKLDERRVISGKNDDNATVATALLTWVTRDLPAAAPGMGLAITLGSLLTVLSCVWLLLPPPMLNSQAWAVPAALLALVVVELRGFADPELTHVWADLAVALPAFVVLLV